jgi:RNA polymerase sigma-70 factor, ECF subfamily
LTDAQLVRGARTGDVEAWRALYQRYLPTVWRQAYALVSDAHAAEDVAAETMLALLRNIGQLDTNCSSVAAWLRSVVRRQAADHHRKGFRQREVLRSSVAAPLEPAEIDPVGTIEADEARDQVLSVLDALPERERLALELKYLDGLSVREIAERLGGTERSIDSILYRARRDFRQLYELKQQRAEKQTHDRPAPFDAPSEQ